MDWILLRRLVLLEHLAMLIMISYDQFGKQMMKLVKKRNEFVLDIERQRRKRREVLIIIITIVMMITIITNIITIVMMITSIIIFVMIVIILTW